MYSLHTSCRSVVGFTPVIFRAAALLASFADPSHVLVYAPGDPLTRRLAVTRTILGEPPSYNMSCFENVQL